MVRPHHQLSYLLTTVLATFLFTNLVVAQSVPERHSDAEGPTVKEIKLRFRYLLDDLHREARSLTQEKARPYALADVADAYWTLDNEKSAELFVAAMDAGLALKPGRTASNAIRYVLLRAAKRDTRVAKRITNQIAKHRETTTKSSSESLEAAIDLLGSDPKTAADFAEAVAPVGLTGDAGGVFILELAQKDPALAERVYRTYLLKSGAESQVPLNQLLWLAGYPFGYGETYGFTNNDLRRVIGLGGRRIASLQPNPPLATLFLNSAFVRIQKTLAEALVSDPGRQEGLNGVSYFSILYLIPEVERYSPGTAEAWWLLRQQAFAATNPGHRESLETQFNQLVAGNRTHANRETPQSNSAESELVEAKKMARGCSRDRIIAKISLVQPQNKASRALELTNEIDDSSMRESVLQFLYYDFALTAADNGNWTEAQRNAARLVSPEIRGLLYVKMAESALRQKDRIRASEILREANRFADEAPDAGTKTSVFLGIAAAFAPFDSIRSIEVLRQTIKTVNSVKDQDIDNFRVLRKVSLSCSGNPNEEWFGNADRAERFSLTETLISVAKTDFESTIQIARAIEDPGVRTRCIASVIRSVLESKNLKAGLQVNIQEASINAELSSQYHVE